MKQLSAIGMTLLVLVLFSACVEDHSRAKQIVLPETPVLAIDASWAVISSSHLRLREQPDSGSRIVTTLWRGNVLEVFARQNRMSEVEGEIDYWYRVGFDGLQGWVFGAYLSFYSSRGVAVSAGERLRQ